uniref:Uncharacterized protein n=1 Tax=Panagrolaimus sp. ES5 TaxID=591445 RepID=A0AC34FWJ0_9BILA
MSFLILFRSGTRTTFFATQVERYADFYSSSTYNFIHYLIFYFFRAPMMLLPHESTVYHLAKITDKRKKPGQSVVGSRQLSLCHENTEKDGALEEKNPPSEQVDSEINEHGSKDYAKFIKRVRQKIEEQ